MTSLLLISKQLLSTTYFESASRDRLSLALLLAPSRSLSFSLCLPLSPWSKHTLIRMGSWCVCVCVCVCVCGRERESERERERKCITELTRARPRGLRQLYAHGCKATGSPAGSHTQSDTQLLTHISTRGSSTHKQRHQLRLCRDFL
jgi:hypothetical protein